MVRLLLTLSVLPMLSKHEVFFKVQAHLLKQNAKSIRNNPNGDTSCLYASPNGRTCAVGCLLVEGSYSPSLEGLGLHDSEVQEALLISNIDAKDPEMHNLLDDLQMCHDSLSPPHWNHKLLSIGRKYGILPDES